MKGFVYILKSLKNNRFYIGSTTDIRQRELEHKVGKVKATRHILPIKMEFFKEYDNIRLARKIECKLKRLKRKDYIAKIIKDKVIKMGLRRSE